MMTEGSGKLVRAFAIYSRLAAEGQLRKLDAADLWEDDEVRGLVDVFVRQVKCTLLQDADNLYLIPIAVDSPFHISNDTFKKKYLPAKAVNLDMYLVYLSIIVLLGCFYDSYVSSEPADFVTMDRWLAEMDHQIEALRQHGKEKLQEEETEYNINWLALVRKWTDLDSLKETSKKQDARTSSRLSFLNIAKNFLIGQHLVRDIGDSQLELTEKTKVIMTSYFMDEEYNHGILNFMYGLDHQEKKEGDAHAIHQ